MAGLGFLLFKTYILETLNVSLRVRDGVPVNGFCILALLVFLNYVHVTLIKIKILKMRMVIMFYTHKIQNYRIKL